MKARLICILFFFVLTSSTWAADTEQQAGSVSDAFSSPAAQQVGGDPEVVIHHLRQLLLSRDLNFEERFDLGTALFMLGRTKQAELAYRMALGVARNDQHRVSALLAAAEVAWRQDQGSAPLTAEEQREAFQHAGSLANLAQRLQPESVPITQYRYSYWTNAEDPLEAAVAFNHGRRMDLTMDGVEVLDPGLIILVGTVAAKVTVILLEHYKIITSEQAAQTILTIRSISSLGL